MRTIHLTILFCIISVTAYSQAWVWEKPISTTSNNITTDPNDNIIILSANGSATTQLSKYNKDGILLWNKLLTKATAFTPSGSVVVDKNGNIYTFTEGFDSVNHQFTGLKLRGVTKFNPQGGIMWHNDFYTGAAVPQTKFAIQLDDNNNVYVGYFDFFIGSPTLHLGNLTSSVTANNYYMAIGSISTDGTPRWLKGFGFVQQPVGGLAGATGFSVSGNKLFITGYMGKYRLNLDNGLFVIVDRCSAWLTGFNTANGQSIWTLGHNLFVYCTGSICGCSYPSVNANTSTGKVILTNSLNGGFVFRPADTIASIISIGQSTVKNYYTIYDSLGNPVKGKIIENTGQLFSTSEAVIGSRERFYFTTYLDTLRKVDTGYNIIWQKKLPGLTIQSVYVPKNGNSILLAYSKAGNNYFAKMIDSAGVISGKVYADWNNDGIYTSADSALSNILITSNSPVTSSISGNDSGKYFMYAAPATYSLNANFNHPYYQFLPVTQSATIAQFSDTISGKDFRLRPLFSFTDVSVKFSALSIARPGMPAYYAVTVKNLGAVSTPIDVGLKLPALTLYSSVLGGTVTVNAPDSITIAMGSVNPFQTKQATLFLNIATNATIADTLRFYPKAYPFTTDTIKSNNLDTLVQPVRTSFDPNEKEVNVNKQPLSDTAKGLVYTIHFQNTGTDTAFYIRIADTLSSKLNIRSFNFIDASHPVSTEVKNNIINFIFNPIILPDSGHNEPKSHGFVKFSIKPKLPINITDTLYNNAAIYFDYNSPVITNSVKSWYYIPPPPPVIVLLSFTGQIQGNTVQLNFTTGSEPGLLNFVIERSTDSINYIPLGTINSAGTSTTGSSYQFIDASPNPVANFYRLKIVYTDGRIGYSSVVVIRFPIIPPTIVLLSFIGDKQGSTVLLKFVTASEPGLSHFVIERSTDSIIYSPLGNINSNGTATTGSSYQFIDISPDPAVNFYRLKIVYTDGRISYSGVVVIRTLITPQSNITEIKVFPNPVKNTLYFSLKNVADPKIFNCTIADATGKIVWSAVINAGISNTYTLNSAFLSDGIYFITLSHSSFAYRKLIAVIH